MKTLLQQLQEEVKTINEDKIREQAIELIDYDLDDEEEIEEAIQSAIILIESGWDDDDDRQFEIGYARWYETAILDIIIMLKKENK